MLDQPDNNDYLTDEESDEGAEFEIKVPALDSLLDQFEAEDEVIIDEKEKLKGELTDLKQRGFEPEVRYEIKDSKAIQKNLLDTNISKQREKQAAILPGAIQDLNEVIVNQKNKLFL